MKHADFVTKVLTQEDYFFTHQGLARGAIHPISDFLVTKDALDHYIHEGYCTKENDGRVHPTEKYHDLTRAIEQYFNQGLIKVKGQYYQFQIEGEGEYYVRAPKFNQVIPYEETSKQTNQKGIFSLQKVANKKLHQALHNCYYILEGQG